MNERNYTLAVKMARIILRSSLGVIPEEYEPYKKQLGDYQNVTKEVAGLFAKHFEYFEQSLKNLSEALGKYGQSLTPSLIALAEHGWYVCGSSEMGDSIVLEKDIRKGYYAKVDRFMVSFYENEFIRIISDIKVRYPARAKIINEAKRAHNNKMYHASTLLFLSTADGIFDGKLFKTKSNKENLKKKIFESKHLEEHSTVLMRISAIDAGEGILNRFYNPLNRHMVVHGKDLNFGNKINSLKALSLLAFICDFFEFDT